MRSEQSFELCSTIFDVHSLVRLVLLNPVMLGGNSSWPHPPPKQTDTASNINRIENLLRFKLSTNHQLGVIMDWHTWNQGARGSLLVPQGIVDRMKDSSPVLAPSLVVSQLSAERSIAQISAQLPAWWSGQINQYSQEKWPFSCFSVIFLAFCSWFYGNRPDNKSPWGRCVSGQFTSVVIVVLILITGEQPWVRSYGYFHYRAW